MSSLVRSMNTALLKTSSDLSASNTNSWELTTVTREFASRFRRNEYNVELAFACSKDRNLKMNRRAFLAALSATLASAATKLPANKNVKWACSAALWGHFQKVPLTDI